MTAGNKCVILGSGNVASCLASALSHSAEILQIYSPTQQHASALASTLGATATDNLSALIPDADFYIIAVKDDAISTLTATLRKLDIPASHRGIWCHTSGSAPLSVLDGLGDGRCVFYPLQTFTHGDTVEPSSITMLLEGDCADTVQQARELASAFTCRIQEAGSEQRRRIHLAAVFASNFANHMWSKAQQILAADGLDLSLLEPLIEATLRKAVAIGPHRGQTGPARRGDKTVMEAHLSLLTPSQTSLYQCVSDSIISDYKHIKTDSAS